ncbi:Pectate lyase/Amb allergen [Macleaya cordata]|uniref:Pectate lyase n=1 Tax=Macleaya cordata TaxID=56857 RepID=A0A200QGY9_MACCD|nr:Pectate lyase/Amb allergen [Macleaya cordata]
MTSLTSLLVFSFLLASWAASTIQADDDQSIEETSSTVSNYTQLSYIPKPGKKLTMNKIDICWRSNPQWSWHRRALADCAVGFGKEAVGGKYGATYVVIDPSDDPINPKPGTLRYGVIQNEPLWIIFEKDMVIVLENELMVNSFKTIDGRGVNVEIAYGPCITVHDVSYVIIHGISIHDCKPGKPGLVRSSPEHVGHRVGCDGDGIDIYSSSNIWIDHCFLARCTDGLLDVIHGSTAITISNNYFTQHDKVMLLGHNDHFKADKIMKVTVVFNHFGPGLVQRMPRVRLGYAHVANNMYDEWLMYAIGGSANPTIFSEGNYFTASNDPNIKEVDLLLVWQITKRESHGGWKTWKWRSSRDEFQNGAYFVQSGWGSCAPNYSQSQSFKVDIGSMVPALTSYAGPLRCVAGKPC